MLKNRIGYLAWMAILAIFLFFFDWWFLASVLMGQLLLAIVMWLLVKKDAANIHIKAEWKSGSKDKTQIPLILRVDSEKHLWGSGSVYLQIEIQYRMFGELREESLILPMEGKQTEYQIPVSTSCCGEINVSCHHAWVCDLLKLFRVNIDGFPMVYTMVYPRKVNLGVEPASMTVGHPEQEEMPQNRKGNDPSEIFDIREYIPGDDIRLIHWKLSSKTDRLVIRESSDPSRYYTAILPDLGRMQGTEEVTLEELNKAVAVGTSICEKLLERGHGICMILPTEQGLELFEINHQREWEKALMQWLSTKIQQKSGKALQYFYAEHLEQCFTRLLVLTAGKYSQNVQLLEGKIGISVVDVIKEAPFMHQTVGKNSEVTEIPAEWNEDECYRIIC